MSWLRSEQRAGDRFALEVSPGWSDLLFSVEQARALIASEPQQVLHESERGVVTLVRAQDALLVVKRSRLEAASRWRRLLSCVRGGDATRALHNQSRLRGLGVRVPEPVLALERKRFGFVIESWHVYRHVTGRACDADDAPRIAAILGDMHAHGWVHRDPHVANFLWDGAAVVVLDCARARPWPWRYAQAYDFVLLEKCCRSLGRDIQNPMHAGALHRLARWHNRRIIGWRRLKRAVRAALGVTRK